MIINCCKGVATGVLNCFIVGSGKCDNIYIPENHRKYVIAADGGYNTLCSCGIKPDMVLGDFDSSDEIPEFENIHIYPREKDETDTAIAVKKAIEMNCSNVFIYGGTGGREDHTYANIQLLSYAVENHVSAYLVYDNMIATIVKNGKISFGPDEKGYISVFGYGDIAKGVTIKGLKYEVEGITVDDYTPIGVSNEFVGKEACISVEDGKLLIMWYTDIKKAIDKLTFSKQ